MILTGTMQDYNYGFAGCMELTLELSCCKYPSNDQLTEFWLDNREALVQYLYQANMGMSITNIILSLTGQSSPG